ncbi:MAG: transposase [Candidatus Marinimicrobia bacterium]|nr:transposase [Candidatus Neomarinimicrobiota bacterium]
METEYKTYKHNPPHLFVENSKYFITASTYMRKPFLKYSAAKEKLYSSLFFEFSKYNWKIEDWVILDNHYHLMVNVADNPLILPRIIREAHRFTALWIKKYINMEFTNRVDGDVELTRLIHSTKKIFYNYWDTCITYDNSYFTRINYIWYNPVKHGYVDSPEEWKFGSYYSRYKEEAEEMKLLTKNYPFEKVKIKDEF